jgi:hypothetical protein
MSKHTKYIILLIIILLPLAGISQRWKLQRAEITGGLGGVNYFGDIGGSPDDTKLLGLKDLEISYTRPNINFGGRYRLDERMNVKANLIFGYVEGSDANSKNASRNYAFSSSVFEISGQYEYSIIPESTPVNFSIGNLRRGLKSSSAKLNTYVFAGLGGVFFNVKPLDDLEDSDRFDDSKSVSLVVPMGIGLKYPITNQIHVGFELGGRWTTTDYLDGFTSEFSNAYDIYYFTLLNVVMKIETSNRRLFKF